MRPNLFVVLLLCQLAACSSLPGARERVPAAKPSGDAIQAAQLASYLTALAAVVQGTPTEQAETVAAARADFDQARQGPAALRYALLLAAPSHPARDPALAQRLLREALARPELLSTIERALAMVELERVSAELRLSTENSRLVAEGQQERERQRNAPSTATLARQLQAANEQNARLARALEEARAKLDAIAELERRNAERSTANEGRTP